MTNKQKKEAIKQVIERMSATNYCRVCNGPPSVNLEPQILTEKENTMLVIVVMECAKCKLYEVLVLAISYINDLDDAKKSIQRHANN